MSLAAWSYRILRCIAVRVNVVKHCQQSTSHMKKWTAWLSASRQATSARHLLYQNSDRRDYPMASKYYPCPECDGAGETLFEKDYNIFHETYLYEKADCTNCAGTGLILPEMPEKPNRLIPALDAQGKFVRRENDE